MLTRRGATLLEMLVAMTLAALVMGTAAERVLRQQRSAALQGARTRADSQLHAGVAEVLEALTGLSPSAGDLAPGEARDTALQVRAALVNGFACDSAAGRVLLTLGDTSAGALTGLAAMPKTGDSLWWYLPDGGRWHVRRVADVSPTIAGCALAGTGTMPVLRVAFTGADIIPRGAPVRVTRQARYSIYRAGDGTWQLGLSEWSDASQRFVSPQPLAGSFLRNAPGGEHTGFRFFDAAGMELPAQPVDVARVARLRVTMLSSDRTAAGGSNEVRRDSADVAFSIAAP